MSSLRLATKRSLEDAAVTCAARCLCCATADREPKKKGVLVTIKRLVLRGVLVPWANGGHNDQCEACDEGGLLRKVARVPNGSLSSRCDGGHVL